MILYFAVDVLYVHVFVSLRMGDANQLVLLIQAMVPISAPYGLCGPYGCNLEILW